MDEVTAYKIRVIHTLISVLVLRINYEISPCEKSAKGIDLLNQAKDIFTDILLERQGK